MMAEDCEDGTVSRIARSGPRQGAFTIYTCRSNMRQTADAFAGQQLRLLYVAKRLKDALRLEATLTDAGIDYVVETERYAAGMIFRAERVGAFFYVTADSDPM